MALAVLLLVNPYAIASVGLQLSFASTLGLILFAGKLQHALEKPFAGAPKLVRKALAVITSALSCTVCATIFTVPILLTSFGAVSVLSPISNLMTVGVTSLCFVGGFVLCVAAAVCPALVPMLAGLVRPLISYLLWSANIIADLGFGTLHPSNTFGLAALGIVFAALLVWLTAGKHVKWKAVLPCLAVVLIGLCIAEVHHQNGRYTVTYLPCGSGQAILLSDTEHAMLIDCGSYRNAARQVREWLRWNGLKRLDTVVLTAVDQGHARNLPELMETVEVGELLMPAGCQERKTNADLLSFVHEREAQEVSEPVTLTNPIAPVELFPITEGKLAVSIADEVLILHSPTEKQLSAYLEQNTLPAAAELVLSANHLSSGESMAQYAEAAGAHGVIIPKRRGVGLTATVAKTSAGAVEYMPVVRVPNIVSTIEELKQKGLWIFCADMDGQPWCSTDMGGPIGIVVGAEGSGVSRLTKEHCDFVVSLPMNGQVNSLNASVAAAIVIYEAVRQRSGLPSFVKKN